MEKFYEIMTLEDLYKYSFKIIDLLFSSLHTTTLLYAKIKFGVLHKHGAYVMNFDTQ